MPSKRPKNIELDAFRLARTKEVNLRVRRLEREEALANKTTVLKADIDNFHEMAARSMSASLYYALTAETPPKIAGLPVEEIRARLREVADSLILKWRELGETFQGSEPPPLEDDPELEGAIRRRTKHENSKRKGGRSRTEAHARGGKADRKP